MQHLCVHCKTFVSTLSNITNEVSRCIWNNLSDELMRLPTSVSEWEHIANGFDIKAIFSHCLGAVDGNHISIRKLAKSGSMYLNYKNFLYIILLAIVDSNCRFLYVSVGSYGKECDSSILNVSTIWKLC